MVKTAKTLFYAEERKFGKTQRLVNDERIFSFG